MKRGLGLFGVIVPELNPIYLVSPFKLNTRIQFNAGELINKEKKGGAKITKLAARVAAFSCVASWCGDTSSLATRLIILQFEAHPIPTHHFHEHLL